MASQSHRATHPTTRRPIQCHNHTPSPHLQAPLVEELEEALLDLQEEHATLASKQRRADNDALLAQVWC